MTVICCAPAMQDTFNSEILVSSKGEKIYVNTLNWGITDDNQISVVSNDPDKAKDRSDSSDVVKGLDPFIYRFKNDTLGLYFDGKVDYRVKDSFRTIEVDYIALNRREYNLLRQKAFNNVDGYRAVPVRKNQPYPPDMPMPSDNE